MKIPMISELPRNYCQFSAGYGICGNVGMISLIFMSLVMLFSSAAHPAQADEKILLKGKVLDSKSKPIPYVSICFKNHPETGSVSDENGLFRIETEREFQSDTLLLSMLGYETLSVPAGDLHHRGVTTIRMKEYYYTIDEAVIKSSKNARKQKKIQISTYLQRVYDRLISVDEPRDGEKFSIASDIVVLRDSALITADHLTGKLWKLNEAKTDGRDSVAVEIGTYSNYLDSSVRAGIDGFDMSLLKKREKKALEKNPVKEWDKSLPHKGVWIVNDVRTVMEQTYEDTWHWVITDPGEGTAILTYYRKKGFVGIITAVMKTALTVDTGTYAVKSMVSDITVNLNLPFGYKLSPAELEILNMVNFTEDDVDKFKIKKAYVHLTGISHNRASGDRMLPSEKSMKNSVKISDRKDNDISLENICTMRVIR